MADPQTSLKQSERGEEGETKQEQEQELAHESWALELETSKRQTLMEEDKGFLCRCIFQISGVLRPCVEVLSLTQGLHVELKMSHQR